jgi:primosomal protein N' (replication factor Y)
MSEYQYYKVAIKFGEYTYKHFSGNLVYKRVIVGLGKTDNPHVGFVCFQYKKDQIPFFSEKVKEIITIIDQEQLISHHTYQVMEWAATYYHTSIFILLNICFPNTLMKGKSLPQLELFYSYRFNLTENDIHKLNKSTQNIIKELGNYFTSANPYLSKYKSKIKKLVTNNIYLEKEINDIEYIPFRVLYQLNKEQEEAYQQILQSLFQFQVFLLYGITGSGKTEIYVRIIREVLKRRGQVLILVPEIALVYQLILYCEKSFTDIAIASIHSHLTAKEKENNFQQIILGKAQIVITTRSGVFIEIPKLQLIIIDEEHDKSFKQQTLPRYNAKHIAIVKGQKIGIPIILGSATPSLESFWMAKEKKKYTLLKLTTKAVSGKLNSFSYNLIDLNKNNKKELGISSELLEKINKALSNKLQVIILYNKLGFARLIFCKTCKVILACQICQTKLIYHYHPYRHYYCHICNKNYDITIQCFHCGEKTFKMYGTGIEKIDQYFKELFSSYIVKRIDSYSTAGMVKNILKEIHDNQVDIIVGTQIIAKGHDFSSIGLIAILNIDGCFYRENWHAMESACQMIYQVAGRTGRRMNEGTVFIQTSFPHHDIFQLIQKGEYEDILYFIAKARKQFNYPPFSALAYVYGQHKSQEKIIHLLQTIQVQLQNDQLLVSDVIPCLVSQKSNIFYYMIVIQNKHITNIQNSLKKVKKTIPNQYKQFISFDINPIDLE